MGSHGLLHQSKYLVFDGKEKAAVGGICGMERVVGWKAMKAVQGVVRSDGLARRFMIGACSVVIVKKVRQRLGNKKS